MSVVATAWAAWTSMSNCTRNHVLVTGTGDVSGWVGYLEDWAEEPAEQRVGKFESMNVGVGIGPAQADTGTDFAENTITASWSSNDTEDAQISVRAMVAQAIWGQGASFVIQSATYGGYYKVGLTHWKVVLYVAGYATTLEDEDIDGLVEEQLHGNGQFDRGDRPPEDYSIKGEYPEPIALQPGQAPAIEVTATTKCTVEWRGTTPNQGDSFGVAASLKLQAKVAVVTGN